MDRSKHESSTAKHVLRAVVSGDDATISDGVLVSRDCTHRVDFEFMEQASAVSPRPPGESSRRPARAGACRAVIRASAGKGTPILLHPEVLRLLRDWIQVDCRSSSLGFSPARPPASVVATFIYGDRLVAKVVETKPTRMAFGRYGDGIAKIGYGSIGLPGSRTPVDVKVEFPDGFDGGAEPAMELYVAVSGSP